MKTQHKRIILTSVAAALLVGASTAAFARPDGMPGGLPGMAFMRMIADLDLSDEQEMRVVRARRTVREQIKEAHKETSDSMSKVVSELEKPAPDGRALHGLADQAIARFQRIVHTAIDEYLALHATLTPAQRKEVVEQAKELNQRRERFKEWRKLDKQDRDDK